MFSSTHILNSIATIFSLDFVPITTIPSSNPICIPTFPYSNAIPFYASTFSFASMSDVSFFASKYDVLTISFASMFDVGVAIPFPFPIIGSIATIPNFDFILVVTNCLKILLS